VRRKGYNPILMLACNTHKVHKLDDIPQVLEKAEEEHKVSATRVHRNSRQLHNLAYIL